eukprot:6135422-Pleurochrysis_carterae.AAC.2
MLSNSAVTPSCTVQRPVSCECVRQCIAQGAFQLHMSPYCFVRLHSSSSSTHAKVTSDIPSDAELTNDGVRFFQWIHRGRWYRPFGSAAPSLTLTPLANADDALSHKNQKTLRVAPVQHCPNACSHHGTCVHPVRSAHYGCQCDTDYQGRSCEIYSPTTCYNNCSFRGTCSSGGCLCKRGFYGPGCAFAISKRHRRDVPRGNDADATQSSASSLRVYVYDLPQITTSRRSWASDWDRQKLFSTAQQFVADLIADRGAMVSEPDKADLLLVPAAGMNTRLSSKEVFEGRVVVFV